MLKISNFEVMGWEHAVRGMRNPKNSWDKTDSTFKEVAGIDVLEDGVVQEQSVLYDALYLGPNDHKLMMTLRNAGTDHRKFLRMITVYVDINAPLYWWKEFDTYKVGTVANSCSTMHKIHAKEFTLDDFSHEHLIDSVPEMQFDHEVPNGVTVWSDDDTGCLAITSSGNYHEGHSYEDTLYVSQKDILDMFVIPALNANREAFLKTQDKKYWWQMIQLLPTSYNQKRTVMLNYEVLANIYKSRRHHKLDCWHTLCDFIEELPYSELITGVEHEAEVTE